MKRKELERRLKGVCDCLAKNGCDPRVAAGAVAMGNAALNLLDGFEATDEELADIVTENAANDVEVCESLNRVAEALGAIADSEQAERPEPKKRTKRKAKGKAKGAKALSDRYEEVQRALEGAMDSVAGELGEELSPDVVKAAEHANVTLGFAMMIATEDVEEDAATIAEALVKMALAEGAKASIKAMLAKMLGEED